MNLAWLTAGSSMAFIAAIIVHNLKLAIKAHQVNKRMGVFAE